MISRDMVQALLENPSEENRERSVMQLTEVFKARAAKGRAATMLEEVIRIFAHDAAVRVRKAVSEQLQHDPLLPQDVAVSLAHDVDDVAIPILRFSRALSDDDLAEIVAKEGQTKLFAIANRENLCEDLSDALIDRGDAITVGALLSNQTSAPSEDGLIKAVDRFGEDDRVGKPLANRSELPYTVMTRMIAVVSDHVLKELSSRQDLPSDLAEDIVKQAEERVFVQMSRENKDPTKLVDDLHEMGRLTPNLAMRALLCGDISFFETAVSKLSNLRLDTVRSLCFDAGALGVSELCAKIKAPPALERVLQCGVATYNSIRAEGGVFDQNRFQARMIERILTDFENLGDNLEANDVDSLIGRLRSVG